MVNPSIFVNPKSGSIKISGTVDVVDVDGNVVETRENSKLCGCGLSKDKPWCDSSHGQYVEIVANHLQNARALVKAAPLFGTTPVRAREIREKGLKGRLEAGEKLVGVKIGGALDSTKKPELVYKNILGYLTDAMQCTDTLDVSQLISPKAETEVVFKLSRDLSQEIQLSEVLDYVSHVAVGMEILDYRFGDLECYADDAIADNAGAAAFAYGSWINAREVIFEDLTAEVFINDQSVTSAPLTAIQGNPWQVIVELSILLAEIGVTLPAGSIVFSGSATTGIAMEAGKTYRVEIAGVGSLEVETN